MNLLSARNPAEDLPDLSTPRPLKLNIRYPDVVTPDILSMRQNYHNLCRLCAAETPDVMPIFKGEGVKYDIAAKIRRYMSLRVLASEILPEFICAACASTLLSFHELVRSARIADYMMRRHVAASPSAQVPTPPPSSSSGTELIKNGVNESLNPTSSNNETEDIAKRSREHHETIREPSANEETTQEKITPRPPVVINENGKRYVSCDTCKKNVSSGSWRRHERAHRGERRYSCHACGATFADSGNLARHARARHDRLRPHACAECGRTFARSTHLQDHERSHRDARDYVCDVCGKASKSAAALRMHARTHDAPCRFRCVECGSEFKRNGELRAHVTIHTGERAHRCPCGRAFRLRGQLTAHARTHAAKPNVVGYVDVGTDAPKMPDYRYCRSCSLHLPARRFNFHVADRIGRVVYRCEECRSFLDKDDVLFYLNNNTFADLPDHVKVHYYETEKAHLEEQAKADPQAKLDLDRLNEYFSKKVEDDPIKRERASGDDRPVRRAGITDEAAADEAGPAAERSTRRVSDDGRPEEDSDDDILTPKRELVEPAKRPKKRVSIARSGQRAKELADRDQEAEASSATHSPKASRTCPICGKQYRASSSYFYHMKYFHKRSREHECSVCNKKFGTKANLAQHASIHTGAYDLECKECGKRFKSKPSLYIHEQSHGGPKRWACSQCGRSFRWRTHLARHVSRHAAERAHVCGTCGRGFSVRCDLLRHARTHAAAEFRCATCGLKFAQKRYLQVHMVKKHAECPPPAVTRS